LTSPHIAGPAADPSNSPLVSLRRLHKRYGSASALNGVSLDVATGEIFGIVGRSGAGKSTLLRCVNLLERPDDGHVLVDGQSMTDLSGPALRAARLRIGMVFQHFNLLARRSVAANVALPLEIAAVPIAERRARVGELLALVGLRDRADALFLATGKLGGHRVGIARALVARPRLLLCDEATSALDPETTAEILQLIRDLQQQLGLTVLLITHEMSVVTAICDRVAVMEAGAIIEQGRVFDVFTKPRHPTTARFVSEVSGGDLPAGTLARLPPPAPGEQRRILRILFAGTHATRAVISEISRTFTVDINIIAGRVDEIGGEPFGVLAVAAYGTPARIAEAIGWMHELNLVVDDIAGTAPDREAA
jgi:D-methionine transport system ATP-binding protein